MKKIRYICIMCWAAALLLSAAGCGAAGRAFDDDSIVLSGADNFQASLNVATGGENVGYYGRRVKGFVGVDTVADLTLPENPVFSVRMKITSGRFKLVLTDDDTVYVIASANLAAEDELAREMVPLTLPAGSYRLKIVGADKAEAELTVSLALQT